MSDTKPNEMPDSASDERQGAAGARPAGDAGGVSYIPIPLDRLRVDTVTNFRIYLKSGTRGKYVLYRERDLVFGDRHKEKLQRSKVRNIFIPTEDHREYMRYLESQLSNIISDASIPEMEKAKIVYECSTQLVQDILEKPWLRENIRRAQDVVQNTVTHLLKGTGQFTSMLTMMSVDYYTYTHSVNVCVLGIALAQKLGLSVHELNQLGTGLLLHDIGKSEIPLDVLRKQTPLTAEEWEIIRNHPVRGVEILEGTGEVDEVCRVVVLQHHEKCTGRGYPHGLAADEIHYFAKIAAIADVFDALSTDRPYKNALNTFASLRLMQETMREDFDEKIFRELIVLMSGQATAREDAASESEGSDDRRRAA